MGHGFAVVDLETTGLFPEYHDRIVEVAVVHVSRSGEIEGAWETLVNPMRDMGAQSIHGISAASATQAPPFAAISGHLSELLRGRVPVAHNATFDSRFLTHAMAESNTWCPPSTHWFCTMQMATTFLPGHRSLADCSSAIGEPLDGAHRASVDAHATARLLNRYLSLGHDPLWWDTWVASAGDWPVSTTFPTGWMPREHASAAPRSVLQRLSVHVEPVQGGDSGALNLDYLALLDRVLLDRHLSVTEADQLYRIAESMAISADTVRQMHHAYFDGLVTAAWADDELTDREWTDIQAIGSLLEIPAETIAASAKKPAQGSPAYTTGFRLQPGDIVVITGATRRDRSEWFELLTELGYVPKDNMVKKAKLLVAADPDSMSGKAKLARDYGIPIVNEEGLERLVGLMG